jgi:hypothetical protein
MRPFRASSASAFRSTPRSRPAARTPRRGRGAPQRPPWILRPPVSVPYVFAAPDVIEPAPVDQPLTEPEPATAASDAAPGGAAADGAEPNDSEVGGRPAPKRRPKAVTTGGASGAIKWTDVREIKQFPAALSNAGGVYIVCGPKPANVPLYVGEAENFTVRWQKRLLECHQAGLFGKGTNFPTGLHHINLATQPIRIWLGTISLSPQARKTREGSAGVWPMTVP